MSAPSSAEPESPRGTRQSPNIHQRWPWCHQETLATCAHHAQPSTWETPGPRSQARRRWTHGELPVANTTCFRPCLWPRVSQCDQEHATATRRSPCKIQRPQGHSEAGPPLRGGRRLAETFSPEGPFPLFCPASPVPFGGVSNQIPSHLSTENRSPLRSP